VVNVSNDMTLFAVTGANIAGSNTVYNQTAGIVNVYKSGVGNSGSFVSNIGYGYFNLTGGTFKSNGSFSIGCNNVASNAVAYVGGTGVLDWSGTGSQTVGYASAASLTVGPGGSVSRGSAANTTWLATNSGSSAIINIAGGSLNLGTAGFLRVNNTASGGTSVTLNVAGGTLTMGLALATNGSTSGNMYANYAGGTLKASATLATSPMNVLTSVSTVFGPIDNVGTAQDFTGGITIDTDGFSMPYVNALLGATGNGVKQADIAITGGSGYIGAPLVQFTGGTLAANGAPASGYAVVSGGAVTEIVITSPGTYTVDPTVTLTGGGGTGASVTLSALTANAADSGLTKNGAGTLTLSGANTYTGPTLVSNGVLALAGGSQTSAITLNTGASLGFTIGSPTITSTSSVTFNAGSTVTVSGPAPTLASYTLMTATSFAGITPVLSAPVAGYELVVDGGTTLKLKALGYASWASTNGATLNVDADHDGDGVQNGVEYFIGGPNGTTTGFTALPGAIDTAGTLSITWPKGAGYIGVYNTDFVVETSDTLSGVWTAETIGGGNITDTSGSVKYTFPAGPPYSGKKFARLKVTGP
jgi:autotransporter-associated beta strand protein